MYSPQLFIHSSIWWWPTLARIFSPAGFLPLSRTRQSKALVITVLIPTGSNGHFQPRRACGKEILHLRWYLGHNSRFRGTSGSIGHSLSLGSCVRQRPVKAQNLSPTQILGRNQCWWTKGGISFCPWVTSPQTGCYRSANRTSHSGHLRFMQELAASSLEGWELLEVTSELRWKLSGWGCPGLQVCD